MNITAFNLPNYLVMELSLEAQNYANSPEQHSQRESKARIGANASGFSNPYHNISGFLLAETYSSKNSKESFTWSLLP